MDCAKFNGKACAVTFEEDMRVQVATQAAHGKPSARAGGEQELIVSPADRGAVESAALLEGVVRGHWTDGLVAPGSFIGIAEETGLIIPLGNWVFREACKTTKYWHAAAPLTGRRCG